MALTWQWNEKCGEAIFKQELEGDEGRTYSVNLYTGNAYLIFLYEWNEDGVDKYNMHSFWVDKEHMKNCLGLNKGYENTYDTPFSRLVKIKLEKKKCRYLKDIVTHLIKAFDNLEIEIYTEEDNGNS